MRHKHTIYFIFISKLNILIKIEIKNYVCEIFKILNTIDELKELQTNVYEMFWTCGPS